MTEDSKASRLLPFFGSAGGFTCTHAVTELSHFAVLFWGGVCSCAQTPDRRPKHPYVHADRPPPIPLTAEQNWGFLFILFVRFHLQGDTLGMTEVERPAPVPEAAPDHDFDAKWTIVLPT